MFDNIITSMKDRFSKNVGNILQSCCYLSEERLKQLFQSKSLVHLSYMKFVAEPAIIVVFEMEKIGFVLKIRTVTAYTLKP